MVRGVDASAVDMAENLAHRETAACRVGVRPIGDLSSWRRAVRENLASVDVAVRAVGDPVAPLCIQRVSTVLVACLSAVKDARESHCRPRVAGRRRRPA